MWEVKSLSVVVAESAVNFHICMYKRVSPYCLHFSSTFSFPPPLHNSLFLSLTLDGRELSHLIPQYIILLQSDGTASRDYCEHAQSQGYTAEF